MYRLDKLFRQLYIDVICFKGSILENQWYGENYLRIIGDLDICVNKENFIFTLELLCDH